jgi:hypothetical protein
MAERTAAEVLAEKLKETWDEVGTRIAAAKGQFFEAMAERLAEDPAITVRTDMVVERFVVEFHISVPVFGAGKFRTPELVKQVLVSSQNCFTDTADHRIVVRPYPEVPDA